MSIVTPLTSCPAAIDLPPSNATVSVSIIDTTTFLSRIPSSFLIKPIYPFTAPYWSGPSYSFLIRHPTHTQGTLLFDLGTRKDWRTGLTPRNVKEIHDSVWDVRVEKDVPQILAENGLKIEDINAVIRSHHHFDHIGDISRFPASTRAIVGPGFTNEYLPSWPSDPDSRLLESDVTGRETLELDFSDEGDRRACTIGGFRALDLFEDGSFYLLDTPGHTVGHISALARTTAAATTSSGSNADSSPGSSFILLGGDIVHHSGEHRPTPCHPLPSTFESCVDQAGLSLPCSSPIYHATFNQRPEEGEQSLRKLIALEADERIWVVTGHDRSLMTNKKDGEEGVEFFPKEANDWKVKGWKGKTFWKFLHESSWD